MFKNSFKKIQQKGSSFSKIGFGIGLRNRMVAVGMAVVGIAVVEIAVEIVVEIAVEIAVGIAGIAVGIAIKIK